MSSPEIKSQTEATNPPKAQTQMTNPPGKVKIKAKYPIRIMDGKDERIIQPGKLADVTEEEAKEFCDQTFNIGHKNTFGSKPEFEARPMMVKRAERV